MAVCAQCLQVIRLVVSPIAILVINVKLARMLRHKATCLTCRAFISNILATICCYGLLYVKALPVTPRA